MNILLQNSTLGPQIYQLLPFIARDLVIDMVIHKFWLLFPALPHKLFRRNILNSPEQLTWKMLLLSTLMALLLTAITLCTSVLLVGLNNGYAITISRVLTLQLCTSRTLH